MNVNFEKNGNVRGVIEVSVTESDYASKVDKQLKEIGKNRVVPGFRKGHISLPELRKRYGRHVKSDVINEEVFNAVYDYIRSNNLHVLGQPIPVDVAEIDLNQNDYTFKYDVALAPELNLVVDKTVHLPFYNVEVTDEMIDMQIERLRQSYGTQGPGDEVDARALVKGSLVELNEDGTVKEDGITTEMSIVAPFMFKDNEESAKFIGKHVGDNVVFNPRKVSGDNVNEVASMLSIDKEQAENVNSDFEMKISEIIVAKPAELNQEFYDKVFGENKVHDEKELREQIKNGVEMSFKPQSISVFRETVHDYFMEKYGDMELDGDLLKRWMATHPEDYKGNIDEVYDEMLPSLKWDIIEGELSRKLEVKVEESDLLERAYFFARHNLEQQGYYGVPDEEIKNIAKQILTDNKNRRYIADEVECLKTIMAVHDAVSLDEKTVSVEELNKILYKQEN